MTDSDKQKIISSASDLESSKQSESAPTDNSSKITPGEAIGENKQLKSLQADEAEVSWNKGVESSIQGSSGKNTASQKTQRQSGNTILQVKDLTYRHITRTSLFKPEREFILGPISFDMQKGETIAIIGNNGSGKTLLAKALAGAIKASAGSIEFIDPDAEPGGSRHRHPIRMILQHSASAMNPAVSVGAMMDNTLRLNTGLIESERQQKIEETLLKVGLLRDHYYYYRHMLSDGQQQRVALARALILDPKIIVADEPFAALDPSVRSQTVNLILKLQHELGLGFFFISHNIGIVRHVSDRVLVLDKGQIIEQGKTDKVFAKPKEALTQKLVQAHFNLVERHLSLL
jgi:cationic peptide transport system ATP-binding protein